MNHQWTFLLASWGTNILVSWFVLSPSCHDRKISNWDGIIGWAPSPHGLGGYLHIPRSQRLVQLQPGLSQLGKIFQGWKQWGLEKPVPKVFIHGIYSRDIPDLSVYLFLYCSDIYLPGYTIFEFVQLLFLVSNPSTSPAKFCELLSKIKLHFQCSHGGLIKNGYLNGLPLIQNQAARLSSFVESSGLF